MDDVINAKVATIERCLTRIREESRQNWQENFTHQDALLLNLERACQASIDAASHVIRIKKLGVPKQSRDTFDQLFDADLISESLCSELKNMVGFRNIAVHDYASLNLKIVTSIIDEKLVYFEQFTSIMLKMA